MKKLLLLLLWMLNTIPLLFAQKTINDLNAEKRNVNAFHGIEVSTGISLILTEGISEEVAVSASTTDFRDKIVTKVENGILKIYYENKAASINTKKVNKDLKAYVSYKNIDKLEVTSGAQVEIEGILKAASLKILANTGAQIKGEIKTEDLKIDQHTGSKITLNGETIRLDVAGETGSKFQGIDLKTSNCNVKVSTGAISTVSAEKQLYIKASTGGNVKYKGETPVREIKKNTGGTVTRI